MSDIEKARDLRAKTFNIGESVLSAEDIASLKARQVAFRAAYEEQESMHGNLVISFILLFLACPIAKVVLHGVLNIQVSGWIAVLPMTALLVIVYLWHQASNSPIEWEMQAFYCLDFTRVTENYYVEVTELCANDEVAQAHVNAVLNQPRELTHGELDGLRQRADDRLQAAIKEHGASLRRALAEGRNQDIAAPGPFGANTPAPGPIGA